MFATIDERREFLGFFIDGMISLLSCVQPGHSDIFAVEENHHALCRLLEHTRCSYPFSDFLVQPNFESW
jgi:hypothetical protein